MSTALSTISIDERMVKSKARCHFIQYMKNKPCKWGFKFWVIADSSGYTVDFDLYIGKANEKHPLGLGADVLLHLISPFAHQGYQLFVDNFYTSVPLFKELLKVGVVATGTMHVSRKETPHSMLELKSALDRREVPRGVVGYYIRELPLVYVCWRDKRALSSAFLGHSGTHVTRRIEEIGCDRKYHVLLSFPSTISIWGE